MAGGMPGQGCPDGRSFQMPIRRKFTEHRFWEERDLTKRRIRLEKYKADKKCFGWAMADGRWMVPAAGHGLGGLDVWPVDCGARRPDGGSTGGYPRAGFGRRRAAFGESIHHHLYNQIG